MRCCKGHPVEKRQPAEADTSALERDPPKRWRTGIDRLVYKLGVYPAAFWREANAGGDQDCEGFDSVSEQPLYGRRKL